jgi:Tfp pilus assembly protein PilN
MNGLRAGLYLRDDRLTVVALSGRRGPLHCFMLEPEEVPGARLKAELESRRLRVRRLRIGLARPLLTVKILELPRARGARLTEMVAFELERHVPFSPEDIRFDFIGLPSKAKGPLRVLVAACERRTVEGALRVLDEPRLKPASVTAACHDLPHLLHQRSGTRRVVWAHRAGGATDLICLDRGRLELSRTVPAKDAEELAAEIGATLRLLDWQDCETVWISGDDGPELLGASALADLGTRVTAPPFTPRARTLIRKLPEEDGGAAMLALAVALGPSRPLLDLLPRELRPRRVSAGYLVTASTASLAALLGLGVLVGQGYKQHRYAEQLASEIRALDPEVKRTEGLAAQLAQKKRLLETMQSIDRTRIHTLPVLKELAERVPQEAWLRTLNMDKQGMEISGQAGAANQLIPLLESSPFFTSVEFTAPVTKTGDKEQFRIKAIWRNPPKPPSDPAGKPQPPPSASPGPRSGAPRGTAQPGRTGPVDR